MKKSENLSPPLRYMPYFRVSNARILPETVDVPLVTNRMADGFTLLFDNEVLVQPLFNIRNLKIASPSVL